MWNAIVDRVTPFVVKVETPSGHGTGFLCLYNEAKDFCGIATAWHVVEHAHTWQQPIRLRQVQSNTTVFLNAADRIIFQETQTDSAVIVFGTGELTLPDTPISLLPATSPLAIGADVGWLGFPAVAPWDLCFFSGTISARQEWRHAYLIDGVAINGVSGGPVLYSTETDGVQIVGTISAYVSNRATGETLPGLSIARDVSHFHDTIKEIKSLDDARRQNAARLQEQQAQEASQLPPAPEPPVPASPPPPTQGAETGARPKNPAVAASSRAANVHEKK